MLVKPSMKRIIRDTFVALVMASSICILIGGIGLVDGTILRSENPKLGDRIIFSGAESVEMGLIGVVLFGWLHERSQKERQQAVTLQTVLQRVSQKG